MPSMDAPWIVATAIAIVAIIVGFLGARHYGTRRRRLAFGWSATPLIPVDQPHGPLLQVTYADIPVDDPYLLTLRLANVGPLDIATEHFDAARPLRIDLDCTFYGLTSLTSPGTTLSTTTGAIGGEGYIEIAPGLLRRGTEWSIEVVVGGPPAPVLTSPLIDTDVVDPPTPRSKLAMNMISDAALDAVLGGR